MANTALDTLVGAVPVVGDTFDILFRANIKNMALLRRHLQRRGLAGRRAGYRGRSGQAALIPPVCRASPSTIAAAMATFRDAARSHPNAQPRIGESVNGLRHAGALTAQQDGIAGIRRQIRSRHVPPAW